MVKDIHQLPIAHVPENYPYVMPAAMAKAAMEHGPIFRIDWPSMSETVCLVGPEANALFYHTHEAHFSHEIGWGAFEHALGKGLITLDEPEHMHYRKMLNPLMTAHQSADHFHLICEAIRQRIGTWEDQSIIDLRDEMQAITSTVAARAFYHMNDMAEIRDLYAAFSRLSLPGLSPADESKEQFFARFDAREKINQTFHRAIALRKQGKREYEERDLIDVLTGATNRSGQPLNEREIMSHLRTMFIAGHTTSTGLGSSLLYLLSTHPAYLERVYPELDALPPEDAPPSLVLERLKEMRLLGYALQEAGRLYGPVGNVGRGAIKEFEFNGYRVPDGTFVTLSIPGGHWLPSVFSQPEQFDPDRLAPPREEQKRRRLALMNFGSGQRMCIGLHLAEIEIKVIAALTLRDWYLEPVERRGIIIAYFTPDGYLAHGLKMRVKRRKQAWI